jgi:hypothetical protein
MTIYEYFETLTEETSEAETTELMTLLEDVAMGDASEADLTAWAEARDVDLTAGREVLGEFTTDLQRWYWDACGE